MQQYIFISQSSFSVSLNNYWPLLLDSGSHCSFETTRKIYGNISSAPEDHPSVKVILSKILQNNIIWLDKLLRQM